MGSAEIAMTRDEMETEMDVVMDRENGDAMDAENGDAMDAKTTAEMTNEKDAEILEIETRAPHMHGEVPPHHLNSPRVCVERKKSPWSYPQGQGDVRAPTV